MPSRRRTRKLPTSIPTSCAPPTWNGRRRALPAARWSRCCSDRATGLVTALMRFQPGAVLPDHGHVKVEQTYVLEGKLVDKKARPNS